MFFLSEKTVPRMGCGRGDVIGKGRCWPMPIFLDGGMYPEGSP